MGYPHDLWKASQTAPCTWDVRIHQLVLSSVPNFDEGFPCLHFQDHFLTIYVS